jgi:hypothetical protein
MSEIQVNTINEYTGANGVTIDGVLIKDSAIARTYLSDAGKVLQVVQGTSTTQTVASTTSYVDLSVSVSITPSSTSSKIFVIVSHFAIITRDGGQPRADIRLVRDSTTLRGDTSTNLYLSGDVQLNYPITLSYLDSPSSTSALTYKTQGKAAVGGSNERLFTSLGGNLDSIVAMEIAG